MRPFVPEDEWTRAFPDWPEQEFRRALVVAAHPDDETLGASGLLQHLHAAGTEVTLVVATDGEAAFPDSGAAERAELGRARRGELERSLAAQGLDVEPIWLGLPDSGLTAHTGELTGVLREHAAGRDLCLLPWPGDPHPDHQAAGRAALAAAPASAHRWSYPIWMWHWRAPDAPDIPWQQACSYRLTSAERAAKAAAVGEFATQLRPGPRGEDPILPREVLAHFDRPVETFFRQPPETSAPVERFAALYQDDTDPWQVETSWYERRKRSLLLGSLPRERYGTVVEPGCGTGVLTRELTGRCDRLIAFDPVPEAAERARAAVPGAEVHEGLVPHALPSGPVDLFVYSELLYYLGEADLGKTIEASVAALRPGGDLVAVHWLPWAPEAPYDGTAVHERLAGHPALETLVTHVDEQFRLDVLRRR
ncbi:bifunctional PIG-L family deacetylase/class I SAM-dependent methyltransferase [Amycolatopsis rubida]|uniref:Bifunctional PIG-L family deacetylase/class I SAM-dependent methyltransferase n=1 Tax=Amycolatopsis rubida TaxID=112413 RepID=A0ABX0BKE4_9PSEU|nr:MULTISPECIES: bifunctional PIG-L family deacetylase/class I SAM-dependent methyltransferase [Amycolatopsis]MYW90246.1 methyltransferase domain-containing protein [Amycolatopsis rubida]NEC55223.1 bifunctional PIG-L family deacetylase/class I SAM-dependent methyltransferase [Amycolatopsis rubida]OAP20115.1 1D-myo-inositol 2-acetamido-2-deoxy-alpha-D-glucopyranoside deacetylase [Amycolatopsis sp. M39]